MNLRTGPLLAALLLGAPEAARAASTWGTLGDFSSVIEISRGMEIAGTNGKLRILALSSSAFRVTYAPTGEFSANPSFAVLNDAFAASVTIQITRTENAVTLDAGDARVKVNKSPLTVTFLDSTGCVISEDLAGRPAAFFGTAFRVWKSMPEGEHYFGLGDKTGPLDRRDMTFTLWNTDAFGWQESTDPLYKSIPFLLAMRDGQAYGVYLDNTFRGQFDLGKAVRGAYSFGADDGALDYYFFAGPDPKHVLEEFTALTGRMPLPPLFALGYQQSRQNYNTQARYRELASEFRKRRIPADVLYMDGGYTIDERSFTIDQKRFPDLGAMVKDLAAQGFKVVASAYFTIAKHPGDRAYDEGMAGGHFAMNADGSVHVGKSWPGDTLCPDFARAETRRWWGKQYSAFVGAGIRGIWNDMNEPAVEKGSLPLDLVHDADGRKTDQREIHNVYGMLEDRATYEGLLNLRRDLRPFILTRAGFAGTQRYAATWTGDNTSTWNHLRISVPQLLNLGVSGWAFAGDDIGGFAGFYNGPDPVLMTRWMELGAFNPLFRNHAEEHTREREPWADGPEHEAIRRKYIETRYRLLPYIYTRMEEASRRGTPLMRPMFLEFPNEAALATNGDEFMFGDALLVAPKVWEIPGSYAVTLPKGTWFDYWTGKRVDGGKTITVDPALDTLPVYARAGSIIPHQPVVQHTGETPKGPLELRVYPGPDCRGDLYADDGESFAFKSGQYFRARFSCELRAGALTITVDAPEGAYRPWFDRVDVIAAGISGKVREVAVDGRTLADWSTKDGIVTLRNIPWTASAKSISIVTAP